MSVNNKQYHTHITSQHKWFQLNLKEVWQYRDLIVLFTKRSFQVTYKQTVLGPAWLFINPIISSLIYCFIFGGIAGMSTDGVPQMLFYLSGNAIWTFFAVGLPKISNLIAFGIQMAMFLGFWLYYIIRGDTSIHITPMILFIPLCILQLIVLSTGFGIIISSVTTKYRDLAILVSFGVQLWMYITPVVYPLSQAGNGGLRLLLLINPVTTPVEVFRYAILGQGVIEPLFLGISWAITILVAVFGIMLFNKVERTFMDTV